ncbi:putative aspartic peptidase domain superfamily [Arabidopsis thaliana]
MYLGICQERTAKEYRDMFETLCLNSVILPGQQLEELFLQGLRPELQAAVRHFQSNGIVNMMDLAQWLEEINNNVTPRTEPYGDQATQAELMSLIIVEGNTYGHRNEPEGLLEDFKTMRQVKRQSATDFTKGKDMRFYGFISGHKVVVVIDSGATNNFISDELAFVLKLPTSTTNQASVLLGQRQCIQTIRTCFGINLLVHTNMMDLAQWLEEINNNVAPRTEPYGDQATQAELMSLIMVEVNTYGHGNEREGLLEDFKTMRQVKRQSATDFTKGKEMRFYGFISGHKVVVVIDSGATNNFISDELALVLKLPTSTKPSFSFIETKAVHTNHRNLF